LYPGFSINENELLTFALVLLRVSAFVVSWPVFSVYSVPNHAKILLALIISMLMFPSISRTGLEGIRLGDEIIYLAGKEVMLGLCLGFITRLFFFAFSIGGNLVSMYMGLSAAHMFNPSLGTQSTTVEQFYLTTATLMFLVLNGHHIFLEGLAKSFEVLPLSMNAIRTGVFGEAGTFIEDVMVIGIKISAPIMIAIFVINIFMGILGRAVPQINVLVTSLPINVMAGFLVMMATIPVLVPETELVMNSLAEHLFLMMKAL
jgi:flagellar biosynthesis protein FliR